MELVRAHFFIKGRVQKVGFRYFLCQEAEKYNLSGWVRNRFDGRVEGVVEGDKEAVEAFLVSCRQGPPRAWVEEVEFSYEEVQGERGFEAFALWPIF
ncbi:MAG: acylphosphatase [Clostridia bacterium]|nr:acylphosphatase [Clostridia bacterium]